MPGVELLEQYNLYKMIGLRIDLCSLGINLCALIVLAMQEKNTTVKLRRAFVLYICVTLALLFSEIISWATLFKPEYFMFYKNAVLFDYFFVWVAPATMFHLVNAIVEYKVKYNQKFYYILLASFVVMGSLIFIPGITDKVVVFSEYGYYKATNFSRYYYYIEAAFILIGMVVGLLKAKEIGIRDSIVSVIFMSLPYITIFTNEWWGSTISILFISFALIFLYGITYQNRLMLSRESEREKAVQLSDAKTKLLLTQIQPHFLYNTLTTLKYLCETNPKEASSLCDNFSDYLRANIDAIEDDGLVPFDKELKNIENYLKIEKARFEDRVKYEFDIKLTDFIIPVLSVQTIVENAVKRGICKKKEGGTIIVKTFEDKECYIVQVIDDGVGFDLNTVINDGRSHVGIINTRERLKKINGELIIDSVIGKGTTVTVRLLKGEN